ncbi:MAG: glycosyltransferase family 4 protein [Gammaproteobacteria bacterium]
MPWRPDGAGGVNRVVLNLMASFGEDTAYRPLLLVNAYPQRRVARRKYDELPLLYEFFLPAPLDEKRVGRSLLSYLIRLPMTLTRFIGLIRREKIVTVNLQYPSLSAFTVQLARFMMFGAFNVVLSFHGADLPRRDANPLARLMWRFVLRRSDAIVACSQALANELRGFDSRIDGAVRVVHNAIDSVACCRKARQSPLPQGLEAHPYLLSVGKFETKKGHDVLIESYERIAPSHPDLWLAIIGTSGLALAACQGRVAASPFRKRVLLYCDVPHGSTLAAIARATLFTLPSRREPFGIVILEAAALAIPVVASRVGGIPEIIQDGHSGVLVPPDDVAALAEALHGMLTDRERANAQAERLRETVGRNFTLAAQMLAYRKLFETSRSSPVARFGHLIEQGGKRPVGR